jgi:hypothetical protein
MKRDNIRLRDERITELEQELSECYALLEKHRSLCITVQADNEKLRYEMVELKRRILPVIKKEKE